MITTEVSFPLTAIEVCPEPEMALKAYSIRVQCNYEISSCKNELTDLIEAALG